MCFKNTGHWKTGQDKPLQAASAGDIMKIIYRIAFLSGTHEGAGRILKGMNLYRLYITVILYVEAYRYDEEYEARVKGSCENYIRKLPDALRAGA